MGGWYVAVTSKVKASFDSLHQSSSIYMPAFMLITSANSVAKVTATLAPPC